MKLIPLRFLRIIQPTLFLFIVLISPSLAFAGSNIEDYLASIPGKPEKDIDLAESLLKISEQWDAKINLVSLKGELDELTEQVKNRIGEDRSPKKVVEALRQVIHREGGYRYTEQVDLQGIPLNPSELFLHGLLQTKRGYCMNLSLLYLIIAERLDIPLYGVALPNHFFVRYSSSIAQINIETTEMGITLPDSVYYSRFGISTSPSREFFMKNLGKKQTLGAYFSNVGMVYYKNSKVKESIFYLNLAVRINPNSIEARNNLGNIYSESKQYGEAIDQYNMALKADPGNLSTLFNLGIAHAESGQTQKAIETFLQAVQINPAFTKGHEVLAELFLAQKNHIKSLLHWKQLTRLDPTRLRPRLMTGTIYLRMGSPKLALEVFQQAEKMFPNRLEVHERLAETYYRMEDFENAVEQNLIIIKRQPQLFEAYVQLGWTHYRMGKFDKAIQWTLGGLNLKKKDPRFTTLAQMNLGLYHVMIRKYSEAETWYQKILQSLAPPLLSGMIDDLRDAAQRYPDRPELDYFAGWIYFEADVKGMSETMLRQYLLRDPKGSLSKKANDLLKRLKSNPSPINFSLAEAASEEIPDNMVEVPAGFFIMGSDDNGEDEAPKHKVYVDTFYMDKYEVAAGDFARFLNTADNPKKFYNANKYGTLVFDGTFKPRPGLKTYPVNNVNWFGARAYCRWAGKALPREAEWEKAARGPGGLMFPWGNDKPSSDRARYVQTWTEEIRHKVMVPVDSMPEGASSYGIHHLAGNVKEWVDDWFDREYYSEPNHNMNPKGQIGGEFKGLRGGSWRDLAGFIYSSFRNNSLPQTALDDYGFRCVKRKPQDSAPKTMTRKGNLSSADS